MLVIKLTLHRMNHRGTTFSAAAEFYFAPVSFVTESRPKNVNRGAWDRSAIERVGNMVVQCAFRNCTNKPNRWSTQSFHQFPTRDPERTKLWLVAGGLDIKTPAETARNWKICSDHFRPDDFEKPSNLKSKASLKSNAVPSVFSDAPTATGGQVITFGRLL